jgi:hypothetical protein
MLAQFSIFADFIVRLKLIYIFSKKNTRLSFIGKEGGKVK